MTEGVEIAPGITVDSRVRFGKPVIKGTRVSVTTILGQLAAGASTTEISEQYGIDDEGIRAALRYATEIVSRETVRAR